MKIENLGVFSTQVNELKEFLSGNKKISVIGIPYDLGSSGLGNARSGPTAIRESSKTIFDIRYFDKTLIYGQALLETNFVDLADLKFSVAAGQNGKIFDDMYFVTKQIAASNKIPVSLGGDHSITFGLVGGLSTVLPEIDILQLDTHSDLSDKLVKLADWRKQLYHANVMSFLNEIPSVQNITSIGVTQTLKNSCYRSQISNFEEYLKSSSNRPLYITIDVDVFAEIKATGYPNPLGFNFKEVISFLREVIQKRKIIGIDIVELNESSKFDAIAISELLLYVLLFLEAKND